MCASQIVDSIDERLLAHGNDLLADVLDDVVLQFLVLVLLLFLILFVVCIILLLLVGFSKLPQELLILLVHTILLFLNCLDYLTLCFQVTRSTVAIAWNLIGCIIPDPLDLSHMHPCFWLRLYFYRGPLCIDVGCASNVLSRCRRPTIEMLSTSEPRELFRLGNDHDTTL